MDVGGRNPANQLRLVVYHTISMVKTTQVVQDFFHQQLVNFKITKHESQIQT